MTYYAVQLGLRATSTARVAQYSCPSKSETGNSFDWYANPVGSQDPGIGSLLVSSQSADGHWSDSTGPDQTDDCFALSDSHATAWDVSTLVGSAHPPPTAAICNCAIPVYGVNESMTFDGSCSYPLDASRQIVSYDWDFNYDGESFVQSTDSNNLLVTGVSVTKPDGYPLYTNVSGGPVSTVALRVTDDHGAQSIGVCNLDITPAPHCPRPSAGGDATRTYHGAVNQPVQFDATGSFDSDSYPMTFAWDFGDDHDQFLDSTLAQPIYTFANAGTYAIALQVTSHPPSGAACTETAFATAVIE
jgi:hypothetical protein